MAAGCGGSTGSSGTQSVDVEFTRADGSLAAFPETVNAWCAPFDESNRTATRSTFWPASFRARNPLPRSGCCVRSRQIVERNPVTTLPNNFVYTEARGASFFALDDTGNELSSADEESKGTIRVELEGCEEGDTVRVELEDVVLGSEYHDLPSVSVEGSLLAEIGDAPLSG